MFIIKRIFILIFLLIFLDLKGQTEIEIKTTGKYIYSWAIEKERDEAIEAARLGLLDTIFISLLRESQIDQTDTVFIKVIDYFEQKIGLKWQVIAFAEKSAVKIKLEDRKKLRAIPVIIGDRQESYKVNNIKENSYDSNLIKNPNDSDTLLNHSNIKTGNNILDELVNLSDAMSLEKKLNKLKADLLVNYGNKSNYPDDSECYIFVIDKKTKRITAVYDKGKTSRKNFLTNIIEDNYTDKYIEDLLVFVVIN